MSKKQYFNLKIFEYISFYVFMFGGMLLHFLYYEGRWQEIAEMADKYLLFLSATFACYVYFIKKAKDYRKSYILEKKQDVYGERQRVNRLHQWIPIFFILTITFLEFNFLNMNYYIWFYFILTFLTMILITSIILARMIGEETKNKEERSIRYETN